MPAGTNQGFRLAVRFRAECLGVVLFGIRHGEIRTVARSGHCGVVLLNHHRRPHGDFGAGGLPCPALRFRLVERVRLVARLVDLLGLFQLETANQAS